MHIPNQHVSEKQKIYDRSRRNLIFSSCTILIICFLNLKVLNVPIINLPMGDVSKFKIGAVLMVILVYSLWKYSISARDVGEYEKINSEMTEYKKYYMQGVLDVPVRLFSEFGDHYLFKGNKNRDEKAITLYPVEYENDFLEFGENKALKYSVMKLWIASNFYKVCRSGFWVEYKVPWYLGFSALGYLVKYYFLEIMF